MIATGLHILAFDQQSALNPAGRQSQSILHLGHLYFWVCVVVYVLVLLVLFIGLAKRRNNRASSDPILHPDPRREKRIHFTIGSAVGLTIIILLVLLVGDFATGRSLYSLSADPNPLVVKVIGHQWWWEVQYPDIMPSMQVGTANEIHFPVGKTVRIDLDSRDVIHSFWIPNLHGKKDMIPGHPTSTWIRADQPGVYYGQCAEFCGHQHAKMRFVVIVESEKEFNNWLESQRKTAPDPQNPDQIRGKDLFLHHNCIMCHRIAGTLAGGAVGPDLTHVASRRMLAAGAIPNTPGHLAGWVTDPQKIKPGVIMPQNSMTPNQLKDLLAYLETLR